MTFNLAVSMLFAFASCFNMYLMFKTKPDDSTYSKLNPLIGMWGCIIIMNMYNDKHDFDLMQEKLDTIIERVDTPNLN